jgi:hypothetical protein
MIRSHWVQWTSILECSDEQSGSLENSWRRLKSMLDVIGEMLNISQKAIVDFVANKK